MTPVQATVAAMLAIAQDVVTADHFDAEQALRLIAALPTDELDLQTRGAIRHAQLLAANAPGDDSSRDAVARFALARVVVMLEQHLENMRRN